MDRWQPSDLLAIKREICRRAVELGASAARVARAERSERDEQQFNAAFERGDLRTWGYDASYARRAADPQAILERAQAVISIAVPYRTPQPVRAPMQGRVSNYAWSNDYHSRMQKLLRTLAIELDERAGGAVSAVACDTRPIAERAFAARAGLGWVGKHTNLIAPPAGSFVFLGEIVTTLPLPPDPELKKTCGSCARCVSACPTGALRGDYTMDASRCISDLTQRTDGIPKDMRPLIGTWVWGCDICQDVCPPNERAHVFGSAADEPASPALAAPDLVRLLHLRSGEFKRTYARSAMGWRGAAILRRNAAVALGNALDRAAVPALVQSLRDDPHPMVRGHAAWALGRIGSQPAITALRERLNAEEDAAARAEIAAALEPYAAAVR